LKIIKRSNQNLSLSLSVSLSFYGTSNSFYLSMLVYASNSPGYLPFLIPNLSSSQEQSQTVGPLSIGWPNSPSPSFVLLTGEPHLSSLPFQSDLSNTRVRALARLPCMCPAHAAWPPRPCARSPSRDVRRPSNLPAHLSPLSRC
jgi:hypothetical protein